MIKKCKIYPVRAHNFAVKMYFWVLAVFFSLVLLNRVWPFFFRALELHPYSLKPLLRRAMAYESMERYRQAYVDYKTLLQIDSGIQAANDSVNR